MFSEISQNSQENTFFIEHLRWLLLTKISELEKKLTDHSHDNYITTPEFNTLAARVFNAGLAQANLITKSDFDAQLTIFNRKITSNKTKHLVV